MRYSEVAQSYVNGLYMFCSNPVIRKFLKSDKIPPQHFTTWCILRITKWDRTKKDLPVPSYRWEIIINLGTRNNFGKFEIRKKWMIHLVKLDELCSKIWVRDLKTACGRCGAHAMFENNAKCFWGLPVTWCTSDQFTSLFFEKFSISPDSFQAPIFRT